MTDAQFNELEGRVDAVGRVLMHLIADLEEREMLDGSRFCQKIHRYAGSRGQHPGLEISGRVMQSIAAEIDDARQSRAARR